MSQEAMKQALEVLEDFVDDPRCQKRIDDASIALRQAIEEAEKQEPVAWFHDNFGSIELSRFERVGWQPLYPHPQP